MGDASVQFYIVEGLLDFAVFCQLPFYLALEDGAHEFVGEEESDPVLLLRGLLVEGVDDDLFDFLVPLGLLIEALLLLVDDLLDAVDPELALLLLELDDPLHGLHHLLALLVDFAFVGGVVERGPEAAAALGELELHVEDALLHDDVVLLGVLLEVQVHVASEQLVLATVELLLEPVLGLQQLLLRRLDLVGQHRLLGAQVLQLLLLAVDLLLLEVGGGLDLVVLAADVGEQPVDLLVLVVEEIGLVVLLVGLPDDLGDVVIPA